MKDIADHSKRKKKLRELPQFHWLKSMRFKKILNKEELVRFWDLIDVALGLENEALMNYLHI